MRTLLSLATTLVLAQSGGAAVFTYDETVLGDLGDDYLIPHVFTPGIGMSTLTGTVSGEDRDLFTIHIASGLSLEALYLVSYDSEMQDPANLSFILSQPGATLTAPPSNDNPYPGGAIGYVGFGEWAEGRNILPFLTVGPPYNYVRTLGAGDYAFWTNETGPTSDYQFRFDVVAVPEPSVLLSVGLAAPLLMKRRRSVA